MARLFRFARARTAIERERALVCAPRAHTLATRLALASEDEARAARIRNFLRGRRQSVRATHTLLGVHRAQSLTALADVTLVAWGEDT